MQRLQVPLVEQQVQQDLLVQLQQQEVSQD
jgi:hypothetical protein